MIVGIDASRNRSGGAKAHLLGILLGFDEKLGIKTMHVWACRSLLDAIPDRPWLVKHHHLFLERSLAHQLFWQAFKLKRSAQSVGCDILFATGASTLCSFSPLVVLSQDLLSYELGVMQRYPWGRDRLRLETIKVIQNLAFRRSKGVLFLTKYAAELVQRSCGSLVRTALAPHGIDDDFRDAAAYELRQPSGDTAGPIRCVYVSNADMYKHQWHVVEAIRLLRDRGYVIELKLIGGGSGLAQAKLVDAIARWDPEDHFVTQLDFVKHSDLPGHLSQADLYIFASGCENLPVTLLEGMAAGLPIACSDRGPMPEVLQDGGVYFDPEDSDSIAAAVQRLIDSKDLRSQVTSHAKRLAANYTWDICSRNTFEFIQDTYLNKPRMI
jgi:glycosyltransferase involved in cell wall biosynthesis